MDWKNRVYFGLLLLILLPSNVFAVTFYSLEATPSERNVKGISNMDSQKATRDYLGSTTFDAYCGSQGVTFTNSQNFGEDHLYKTEKHCSYTLDGNNNNAYCNRMVARVIQVAREDSALTDSNLKWRWAQMCVWAYLGHNSNKYMLRNNYAYGNVESGTHTLYGNFQGVIAEAARRYVENGDDAGAGYDVSNEIGLNVSDNNFYYVPENDSCSGGGYYLSKKFSVKNNSDKKRQFNISVNVNSDTTSNPIYICSSDENAESCNSVTRTIELIAHGEKQFYLRTASLNIQSSVKLKVELVPYIDHRNVEVPDTAFFNNSANQPMIVYIPNSSDVSLRGQKEANYNFLTVDHKTCDDYNDNIQNNKNDSNSNTYPANELVQKSCVNSLITAGGDKHPPERNKYEANFANCDCTTIDLGNGKKVNVRIYENVSFRFGILNPTLVYPGGGIRFAKKGESITTDYVSNITWRYVDYNADGTPYYYNPSNLSDNVVSNEMHNQINENVKSIVKEKLDLKFSTIDSNSKDKTPTTVTISNQLNRTETSDVKDGKEYVVVTVKTADEGISMNHANFSTDGIVSYDDNDSNYPIDGGYNYYLPMNYDNSKFPFKISDEVNLSALSSEIYKFRYIADCEIEVGGDPDKPDDPDPTPDPKFFDKAINYRSIDLSNPFPKANASTGEGIKENWKDWYMKDANKQRLKNAYNNYPGSPLYSINMNGDLLNRIGNINDFYANWSSVEKNGFDKFLRDYNVDYSRANDSYCEINQFSSDCDK